MGCNGRKGRKKWIYLTGDTNSEVSRFEGLKRKSFLFRRDTFVEAKLEAVEARTHTTLFLDGNHECFPEIFVYPEEMWNGGKIHCILQNLLYLMHGQVYDLTGLTVFTMGGDYSIDVMYRIPGRT